MEVSKHKDSRPLHPWTFLDKLAVALVFPECGEQGCITIFIVVLSHDLLDGLCGFLCMVEWDRGHKMVKHMGPHNVVEEMRVDEPKVTIDGGCSASGKCPLRMGEVWESAVGVLKESNEHYSRKSQYLHSHESSLRILTYPVV